MSTTTAAAPRGDRSGLVLNVKAAMAVLGFASGLPLVVFQGTIAAWLTEAEVDTKAIGVLSMASLPYVFKFLWSPAVAARPAPLFGRLFARARLRSWIMLGLTVIAPIFLLVPLVDPAGAVWLVALLTLLGIFASATQDIAIGAWRIRIARDETELDTLVAIEQFSYRTATFFGGSFALLAAGWFGWTPVWLGIGALFALCFACVFFLPDPAPAPGEDDAPVVSLGAGLGPAQRRAYVLPVVAVWAASLVIVFGFMFYVLGIAPETSVKPFTFWALPVIATACVGAPVLAACLLRRDAGPALEGEAPASGVWDALHVNLLEPFVELVGRLRWGLLPFLFLVLFYRYADGIWGALAYPFYLGAPEVNGGLGFRLHEISAASKIFGVFATMGGFVLGRWLMDLIGRMPTLMLGAVLASVTNLLYADLALGGSASAWFIETFRLGFAVEPMVWLSNALAPPDPSITPTDPGRFGPLLLTILAENLALGIASVAFVAYISSVVAKKYAAVQFAIFASVYTFVATLSRPILGELADERGFAFVFVLTAVLGLTGIVATAAEWVRRARQGAAAPSADPAVRRDAGVTI